MLIQHMHREWPNGNYDKGNSFLRQKKKWLFCESASRILGLDALTIKFAESLQLYREIGVLQMLKPIVPARAQDLADQHLIWYCPASC